MNHRSAAIAALLATLLSAGCAASVTPPLPASGPVVSPLSVNRSRGSATSSERDIYYYQTQYSNGVYVSLSPIWKHENPTTHAPFVTDLIIAAFHLGYDSNNKPYIHLNDNVPGDPMFDVMWPEVAHLQRDGVTARMMLGGAAQGSYADLFSHWAQFYPILKRTLAHYKLNGIDLDVEENVSLSDIEKLIDRLHKDFGDTFLITLAPVASALSGGANLSGFNYDQLYASPSGKFIAYFDAQFYSGFGSLGTTADYERVIAHGYPPDKVVGGTIANPADGNGFVPIAQVASTVRQLVAKYPRFGGVYAWEYFNALPGGPLAPAKWATVMGKAIGP